MEELKRIEETAIRSGRLSRDLEDLAYNYAPCIYRMGKVSGDMFADMILSTYNGHRAEYMAYIARKYIDHIEYAYSTIWKLK